MIKELFFRLMPSFITNKIQSREGMQRMTQNFAWLLMDKVLKMSVVMAINIWAYRYLGPENVGIWNYAIAFVTILTPLANLGIDGILVRDLVNNPLRKNELLGASFMVKLLGSIFMTFFAVIMIYLRRPDDSQMIYYIFVIASSNIFLAFDVIDLYNQSELNSKFTVLSKSIGYLSCAILKVGLIIGGLGLDWFIWIQFAENAIGAVFLIYWFQKQGGYIAHWKLDFGTAKELLSQSWPIILTSILMIVQQNIDQIFLGDWISDYELGQFSTAAKLIALFGFIPMIIQSTVAPEIAKAKNHSNQLFMLKMTKVYQIMFVVSFIIIGFCVLFGKWIVILLYGIEYEKAGTLMALMSIRLFFVNYSVAKTLYITNLNLFRYFLVTGMVGASINIALNYYLIPIYESNGAIWASIISFLFSIIIIDIFYKPTRQNFKSMMNSIFNLKSYFDALKK